MAGTSESSPPLYVQIRDQLIERFIDFPLDTQLPTNRQLAEEFGVALLTIKRAMDTLASDGYIDRRQGKGTFLRSHERRVQTTDRTDRPSGRILVAVPSYFSHEYWKRVDVAAELSLRRGFGLAEYRFRQETTYVDFIASAKEVDNLKGILIDPVPGTLTPKVAHSLDEIGVPVLIYGHCQAARTSRNLITIQPDWYQMGYKLAEELLAAGHRRIGFVEAEPPGQDGNLRLKGIRQALADAGLGKRDLRRSKAVSQAWDDSIIAAHAGASELVAKGCTGLIIDSVVNALGVYQVLHESGLRCPDDVSVIASGEWWNNREAHFPPPLTTVCSSIAAEIELGFDLIADQVTDPLTRTYECDVTVRRRASIAPPPR